MIRTFAHRKVIELARGATVPVINGLTDLLILARRWLITRRFWRKKARLKGSKIAYIGDGNNMVHSLMMGASKLGCIFAVASPEGYEPDEEVIQHV